MPIKLGIGSDDQVILPRSHAEDLGLTPGDEVKVATMGGVFTLVGKPGRPKPYFAAAISALSVPEALNIVFTSLKTGVMIFRFWSVERDGAVSSEPARSKSIYFRDGQVVFASSNDPADRLGPILWRNRLIELEPLERHSRAVKDGRHLGQILVDAGLLTAGQIYDSVRLQVREILLSTFLETEGDLTFIEGPLDEPNAVKLPERTRDLLLEGMKRVDEVERLASRLPDCNAVLSGAKQKPNKAQPKELKPKEARLLASVDGKRTARKAFEKSELDTYSGLKALAVLVEQGLVTGEPRAAAAPAPSDDEDEEVVFSLSVPRSEIGAISADKQPGLSGPLETYRRIFRHIYQAISKARSDALDRLNSYFPKLSEKQQALFHGVRMKGEGEIDLAQVVQNGLARGVGEPMAKARALEALEGLLAFMRFEVKNCLPPKESEAVLREVSRLQMHRTARRAPR